MKYLYYVILAVIVFEIFFTGYTIGHYKGYSKSTENRKKLDCELEYSLKEYTKIPGNCLKYFIEK